MNLSVRKKQTFTGHAGAVYVLTEFTPGWILSGSSDRLVAAWNPAENGKKQLAQFPAPVYSLLYLEKEQRLVAGTGAGSLHLVDLAQKAETKILQLHQAQVFDLAFSPKHRMLFSAGGDGQLAVTAADEFAFIRSGRLCAQKIRALALSPGEQQLAVACGDGSIRIFALPEMKEMYSFHAHDLSANSLAWHPGGRYLLSGGRDAYLRAWDVKNDFAPLAAIPAHNFAIYRIVFSPDRKLFATASRDKTIKLWNAEDISFLLRINKENFDGHVNSVNALLWNEGGLISAGDDRAVLVWEVSYQ